MTFHPDHWTRISSTNPLERLIGEIKRRTDVAGASHRPRPRSSAWSALLLEAKQPGDPRRLRAYDQLRLSAVAV
jgi:transposase-like protein